MDSGCVTLAKQTSGEDFTSGLNCMSTFRKQEINPQWEKPSLICISSIFGILLLSANSRGSFLLCFPVGKPILSGLGGLERDEALRPFLLPPLFENCSPEIM